MIGDIMESTLVSNLPDISACSADHPLLWLSLAEVMLGQTEGPFTAEEFFKSLEPEEDDD